MKTKLAEAYENLRLIPYMRSTTETLRSLNPDVSMAHTWGSWTNNWGNIHHGGHTTDKVCEFRKTLAEHLRIREDNFIFNLYNRVIFHTDPEGAKFLRDIGNLSVDIVQERYPRVLQMLRIA